MFTRLFCSKVISLEKFTAYNKHILKLSSYKPCSSNVVYDCTVDKLVLSDHLHQMHPLLPEVFETLRNVKNLGETIII